MAITWLICLRYVDYVIPKGSFVVPFLSAIHQDENFHEKANSFNPWRWMDPQNQVSFIYISFYIFCYTCTLPLYHIKNLSYIAKRTREIGELVHFIHHLEEELVCVLGQSWHDFRSPSFYIILLFLTGLTLF